MPHTRNAKKRMRQNEKRRLRNRAVKKEIKTYIKRLKDLVAGGSLEQVKESFNAVTKKLDKAAARRIVHPNLAARKKSQLARLVHKKEKAGAGQ
jgi:small subunit ribosomal protein S20